MVTFTVAVWELPGRGVVAEGSKFKHTLQYVLCLSEIFLPQLCRRRLLASGQDRRQTLHTCYFWQAASAGVHSTVPAHSVCLRSVEIFDWKD